MGHANAAAEYSFSRMDRERARWTVPQIYAPPRDLSGHLDQCFITRGMSSQSPSERGRRMPEGASYIVLLRGRRTPEGVSDEATLVVGGAQQAIHDIPTWSYEYQCGLRIQPGAGGLVLGTPATAVKNAIFPLRELWGDDAARLLDRLLAARSDAERVEMFSATVRQRLRGSSKTDLVAVRLARAIRRARGNQRLGALAKQLGTTVRTLERRFDGSVGLSPKQYQRIARIARVFDLVGASGRAWADVAVECGYYDQSHLVEDCHQILGRSPERFLSRLTNVASLEIGLVFENDRAA